jgi:hypothetical protein
VVHEIIIVCQIGERCHYISYRTIEDRKSSSGLIGYETRLRMVSILVTTMEGLYRLGEIQCEWWLDKRDLAGSG